MEIQIHLRMIVQNLEEWKVGLFVDSLDYLVPVSVRLMVVNDQSQIDYLFFLNQLDSSFLTGVLGLLCKNRRTVRPEQDHRIRTFAWVIRHGSIGVSSGIKDLSKSPVYRVFQQHHMISH